MFIFEDNKSYRMPPFFGAPDFNADYEVPVNDVLALRYTQTTDTGLLEDYLPEGFELLRPELIIKYCQLREAQFIYGGGYNLAEVDLPVRFKGQHDQLEGVFPLIVWENNTRPIIGGREESGQPKLYADISDLHPVQDEYFATLSYDGNTFLQLYMFDPQPIKGPELEQIKADSISYNVFGWRYIPKIGAPGADLSQPVLYPQGMTITDAWVGQGSVQWSMLSDEYQYVDPVNHMTDTLSQYRIIEALSKIPIKATSPVAMVKGSLMYKPFAGRVLE